LIIALSFLKRLNLSLKFTEVKVLFQFFFKVGKKFIREAILVKLFETLEIFDMALVTLLVSEGGLAVNRRAVRHVTLTEDSRVSLRQML
jgi:hypothetical protein